MRDLDYPGSFGDWLKVRRKALDLTQEETARRAGCSVFALRKIETGERRPSRQLAGLLAAALELPEHNHSTFIRVARGELTLEPLLFHRSIETFGDYIAGWDMARSYTYLGDAILSLGDIAGAREIYSKALQLSKEANSIPLMLDSLAGLADCDLQTGQPGQASELCSVVLHHISSTQETKDRAARIKLNAEKPLDPGQIQAIHKRISDQSIEWIVNELIPR